MSGHLAPPTRIPQENLDALNPLAITSTSAVCSLLNRVRELGVDLWRGTNQHALSECATLLTVGSSSITVETTDFGPLHGTQLFLSFSLDGRRYLFSGDLLSSDGKRLELTLPKVLYLVERRDRQRRPHSADQMSIVARDGSAVTGELLDESPGGLGIRVGDLGWISAGANVQVGRLGESASAGGPTFAEVRNVSERSASGWTRIGLAITYKPSRSRFEFERRTEILKCESRSQEVVTEQRSKLGFESRLVGYLGTGGRRISAIVDTLGQRVGAPAVVIPPAWGRTKESTVALSEAILATFAAEGEAVSVVRFDGIRRRGESFNDPACVPPLDENLNYTFSQGVRDISSTVDFLRCSPQYSPDRVVLATVSIAAVEGRKAVVEDTTGTVAGWVSLVGVSDPQTMIRVVSGGIDYFAGADQQLKFGIQYIQGLRLDIDRAAADALNTGIAFLDDARRDMAEISVPVVWICGEHDAWTPIERVKDMLAVGASESRRLLQIPVGHQLRRSEEAIQAFQLAAVEIAGIALSKPVLPARPDPALIRRRRKAERGRLKAQKVGLPEFWHDYLLGHDERLGIELVSSTRAYRSLMDEQVEALQLRPSGTVVDLGSGAGAFPVAVLGQAAVPGLRIVEVDLVPAALRRARARVRQHHQENREQVEFVAANLDSSRDGAGIPLADGSADAVLASLLVNYLAEPRALLAEISRVLRPGGRLVMSGMRPDADVSKICVAGVGELRSGLAAKLWRSDEVPDIDQPLQEFISNGARLLDLEEAGAFNFWGADELGAMVTSPYLRIASLHPSFGDPPQALVVVAERTEVLIQ